jgi:hypothetical protein
MVGNALHGAGSTPMFTLGTTFIDENTEAEMTSFYLGEASAMIIKPVRSKSRDCMFCTKVCPKRQIL